MQATQAIVSLIAAAIAGGLIEYLLGLALPRKPNVKHIVAIMGAVIVFTLIALLFDGSSKQFYYALQVESKRSGAKIANAEIVITVEGKAPTSAVTDINGYARIQIPGSYRGRPARLSIDAIGFESYDREVDLDQGDFPVPIQLDPILPLPTVSPTYTPISTPTPVFEPDALYQDEQVVARVLGMSIDQSNAVIHFDLVNAAELDYPDQLEREFTFHGWRLRFKHADKIVGVGLQPSTGVGLMDVDFDIVGITLISTPLPALAWSGQVDFTLQNCNLSRVFGFMLDRNGGVSGGIWLHYWADDWEGAWVRSQWSVFGSETEWVGDEGNWDGIIDNHPIDGVWHVCVTDGDSSWDCISNTVDVLTSSDCVNGTQDVHITFQQN